MCRLSLSAVHCRGTTSALRRRLLDTGYLDPSALQASFIGCKTKVTEHSSQSRGWFSSQCTVLASQLLWSMQALSRQTFPETSRTPCISVSNPSILGTILTYPAPAQCSERKISVAQRVRPHLSGPSCGYTYCTLVCKVHSPSDLYLMWLPESVTSHKANQLRAGKAPVRVEGSGPSTKIHGYRIFRISGCGLRTRLLSSSPIGRKLEDCTTTQSRLGTVVVSMDFRGN